MTETQRTEKLDRQDPDYNTMFDTAFNFIGQDLKCRYRNDVQYHDHPANLELTWWHSEMGCKAACLRILADTQHNVSFHASPFTMHSVQNIKGTSFAKNFDDTYQVEAGGEKLHQHSLDEPGIEGLKQQGLVEALENRSNDRMHC